MGGKILAVPSRGVPRQPSSLLLFEHQQQWRQTDTAGKKKNEHG